MTVTSYFGWQSSCDVNSICCFPGYLASSNQNYQLQDGEWWRFLYCSILNFLNLIVCLIGSSMFAKTNVSILGIVCVSLLSSIISFLCTGEREVM